VKKTAVLLYPQFSEYELSVALSILMQGGKQVVTVGVSTSPIRGESGLTCIPDVIIDELNKTEVDSLVLTGCMDVMKLADEESLITFLIEIENNLSVIASISSSPFLLAKAGLLKGKKYTVGMLETDRMKTRVFESENYSEETVVQDGKFITARGSGFVKFGIALGNALELTFDEKWYDSSDEEKE
jgi:protein deglycase